MQRTKDEYSFSAIKIIKRSGIVLAGGASKRFGYDKGLCLLGGEILVHRVVQSLAGLVDEVLCVVSSEKRKNEYQEFLSCLAKIIIDVYPEGSPLIGLITGLRRCQGDYALVAACDMPFINPDVVCLLFHKASEHNGAVIVKPNGWIEPFLAVYKVTPCLAEAERLYRAGDLRLRMVFRNLKDVVYVAAEEIAGLDPNSLSFFDADTEEKLSLAETILKRVN